MWDLPSGHLVDLFRVKKPISSLSFSPLGDFLATTHANSRAISLWCVSNCDSCHARLCPCGCVISGLCCGLLVWDCFALLALALTCICRANQSFFSTVFLRPVDAEAAPTLELPTEPVEGSIPSDVAQRTNTALFPSLATLSKVDATRINVRCPSRVLAVSVNSRI